MPPEGLRAKVEALLGGAGCTFARVRRRGQSDCHGWVLEDLLFETGGEPVPAFFLRPPDGHAPVPALLYAHAHGNAYAIGRDELTQGRPALHAPYAGELVALGCAALCLEMPGFGARQDPTESARAKAALWRGETLFGQMLAEQRAGLDWLAAQPVIDAGRLGALGLSMGATLAWWLAALDPRLRAAAALCCLADLETLVETGAHDLHGLYMSVPGLFPLARTGQIAGLAAPRALLVANGARDPLTPPAAQATARADLEAAYGAQDAINMLIFHDEPETGHEETAAMRAAVRGFLRRHLVGTETRPCTPVESSQGCI